MTYKLWFTYIFTYVMFQVLISIVNNSTNLVDASVVNDAVGFQVDQVGSGSGFFSTVRTVTSFFTTLVPQLITFSCFCFSGDLEFIRWMLMAIFGGPLVVMMFMQFVGSIVLNRGS